MTNKQIAVDDEAVLERPGHGELIELTPYLAYQRLAIANVMYVGAPGRESSSWVLVDAGVMGMKSPIVQAAEARFGAKTRPQAIVLTHGHFDHVGSLRELAEEWDVPIYAHELEIPFLNGSKAYPPPDPTVGGGMMAALSGFYPRGPFDFRPWLRMLPSDGAVSEMPGWKWIHTPGHTPGHISLWYEVERTLIVGDAFITTRQESAYAVMTQSPEMHGPPMYYTPDWERAGESVARLDALRPELVVTGHGPAMSGPSMRSALDDLTTNFREVAVPKNQQ